MQELNNTIKLLRIPFSLFLMPVFLLALSQQQSIQPVNAIVSFLIIHLLVYPASNGYNSYIDKDTGSIGGIEHPPQPTRMLFYATVAMDILALCLAAYSISLHFAICLFIYILASKAYSSRWIRLKKYPLAGFLTVVVFQGGFTYYMSVAGIAGQAMSLDQSALYLLLACSFQLAGAYPLTQVYQHEQDRQDGVTTISYRLGYRGTFFFAIGMFAICNVFYFLYFDTREDMLSFYLLQCFFLPVMAYFVYWFLKVWRDQAHASFRYAMGMNLVAAICMNACFSVLLIIHHCL